MGIKYSGIFKKLNLFNMTFNYGKEKLTLKKTFALAQGKTKGVLIPEIKSKVEKSNAIVHKVVHFGRTVYGINTGFGPLCDTLISENETKKSEKDENKKSNKDALKSCKEITKKIDTILALYFGRDDTRQGITSDPVVSVTERIGTALYYVSTRQHGITDTERGLIEQAKTAIDSALKTTNNFFEKQWVNFQTEMEAKDLSPFKTIDKFDLKN